MRLTTKRFRPRVECLETRLTPANNPSLIAPAFSSLPGAPATIYLDFNGHFDATWANFNNIDTPEFDIDGNRNAFNAAEQKIIEDIWREMAEDYAPFNINVTTVLPPSFAPKSALRVLFGGDGAWLGVAAGGVALLNTFGTGAGVTPTCFVFAGLFGGNALDMATAGSHEAGHMFGLEHQSVYDAAGNKTAEYSPGLGAADGTGPVMGVGYGVTRTLWWFGPNSSSATTMQDDMAVIANNTNGFGFRKDDFGNSAATATEHQAKPGKTAKISEKGLITQMTDTDWISFSAKPGPVKFTVTVPAPFNNLDPKIQLRSASGKVIATANPGNSFNASLNFKIKRAGTYHVVVSASGLSSAATQNNRGQNVGTYTLIGEYEPISEPFRIYSPTRWLVDPSTNVMSGVVTIAKAPFTLRGPITLAITLPHDSLTYLGSNGQQSGRTVIVTLNKGLKAGKPLRFFIDLHNPERVPLGNFFIGMVVKLRNV